jgi:DNA-binding Lrp family transcriptional regulator
VGGVAAVEESVFCTAYRRPLAASRRGVAALGRLAFAGGGGMVRQRATIPPPAGGRDNRQQEDDSLMVNAFVLINIEGKKVREIGQSLLEVNGVTEVYSIAGEYDFLVVIRVPDNAALANIVTEEIFHKPGVRHTKTLFALDSYSKVDLNGVFKVK